MERLTTLREIVSKNPGADEFVELATLISESKGSRAEAREVCFRGLTKNPKNAQGRLLLAKLFYLDEMPEFAVRELIELRRQVGSFPSLERLISNFGVFAEVFSEQDQGVTKGVKLATEQQSTKVVAEIDFDEDFLDILNELGESDEEK